MSSTSLQPPLQSICDGTGASFIDIHTKWIKWKKISFLSATEDSWDNLEQNWELQGLAL
jgi:hypothetical protein